MTTVEVRYRSGAGSVNWKTASQGFDPRQLHQIQQQLSGRSKATLQQPCHHVTFPSPIPSPPYAGAEPMTRGEFPNPAVTFEPYRRRLLGLAYRMLGSMSDAEDAVQETYLRWHGTDRDRVSDPRAFLMTTTTRVCLDMLTSA